MGASDESRVLAMRCFLRPGGAPAAAPMPPGFSSFYFILFFINELVSVPGIASLRLSLRGKGRTCRLCLARMNGGHVRLAARPSRVEAGSTAA